MQCPRRLDASIGIVADRLGVPNNRSDIRHLAFAFLMLHICMLRVLGTKTAGT